MGRNGSARSVPPRPCCHRTADGWNCSPAPSWRRRACLTARDCPTPKRRTSPRTRRSKRKPCRAKASRRRPHPRCRQAGTRRNPSDPGFRPMPGKPATATRTRRKTQRTVTTPLQRPVRRNPTPVYCPRRRGRRISAETNPATSIPRGQGTCPASSARECGAARPTIRTSPRSWKGSWPTCSATTRARA